VCSFSNRMLQKTKQQILRPNKKQLLHAMDAAGIAAWQYKSKTREYFFSRQMEVLHGFKQNALIQHTFDTFITFVHPDDKRIFLESFTNTLEQKKEYSITYRVIWPDKSIHWIRSQFYVIYDRKNIPEGIGGICTDITEQEIIKEQLRQSERQLQAIIDGSPTVISLKDIKGKYRMVNRQFEILFHLNRERVKDKTDYDIWPSKEIAEKLITHDKKALTEERAIEVEEKIPQDDGMHTYISAKFPLFDNRGVPYVICNISTDITETKKLEERKDEFISMASHELKTPITSIKGFNQILQKMFETTGQQRAKYFLSRMDEQIDKLTKLVTELLDVSKMQQGKLPFHEFQFDIDALVKDVVELIQP